MGDVSARSAEVEVAADPARLYRDQSTFPTSTNAAERPRGQEVNTTQPAAWRAAKNSRSLSSCKKIANKTEMIMSGITALCCDFRLQFQQNIMEYEFAGNVAWLT